MTDSRRRLGLPSATGLVVASMIGVGVFTTSGFALADLGSPARVLLAWAVGGAIAIMGALCYGALASHLCQSGGEYHFLSRTLHPMAGFLAGWLSLLVGFTAPIAAAARGLEAYLPLGISEDPPVPLLGTAAIALAAGLHGMRRAPGIVFQTAAVGIKVGLLVLLVAWGLPSLPAIEAAPAPAFSLPTFAVSLVWISLSYSGWNAAVYVGGEVRDPERNLPRSLLLGTLLVTALYLLLNAVFVYAAPVSELAGREDVAAAAAHALGGAPLERLVRVIVALALFTSISAMVMAGPRVYARMAEDGLFPKVFSQEGEVPVAAVMLQAALAILVLWAADLQDLLGYIGFTLSLSTAAAVVGLARLRVREGAERVPVPGWPWLPALFVLATLSAGGFMMLRRTWEPAAGLATLAVGALLYALIRRRSPAGGPDE